MAAASILITVFNCERYIDQSVASALAQTLTDLEVIVIDDGSTDRTAEKLDAIKDTRLKALHCPRMGRAKALNLGIASCSSPYVAILDADDISLVRRLESQTAFLNSNPDIALVGSQFRVFIDEDGRRTGQENTLPVGSKEIYLMLKDGKLPLSHSTVMFRQNAIRDLGGYDESLPCFLDLDLYARVAAASKMANIAERLSLKRLHPGQFFGSATGVLHTPEGRQARATVMRRIAESL